MRKTIKVERAKLNITQSGFKANHLFFEIGKSLAKKPLVYSNLELK